MITSIEILFAFFSLPLASIDVDSLFFDIVVLLSFGNHYTPCRLTLLIIFIVCLHIYPIYLATLGHLHPSIETTASIAGFMATGGVAGHYIGHRVEPTSLPQTVAAFHSLVGISASTAAIGDYLNCQNPADLDNVHLASIYLANTIGSVTTTGSLVAYGKLDGKLDSAPLQHPARDQINMGLGAATLGAGAVLMGMFINKIRSSFC